MPPRFTTGFAACVEEEDDEDDDEEDDDDDDDDDEPAVACPVFVFGCKKRALPSISISSLSII